MRPDVEMSLGEHLAELRTHLIRALAAVFICAIACGVFYAELFNFIAGPYEIACKRLADRLQAPYLAEATPENPPQIPEDVQRQVHRLRNPQMLPGGPTTLITTVILMCMACGVLIASPWVFYQIWAFVGVGLHEHERRFVYIYGPFSFMLFLAGAAFAYFTLMLMLQALMSIGTTIRVVDPSQYTLTDYIRFVAWTTLAFGLAFQTPLIVMFLERTGIVPLAALVKQQRMVILVMCIVAAVFTPGTDPISMASMAVPLVLLYQLGLFLAWITGRKRRKQQAADRAADEAADRAADEAADRAADKSADADISPYGDPDAFD
ncbi:MAG: twin-arginine translocase subunit TatC [Planctomycetes bacterium]|nr:twin-arginine translocase subunit TatC [Planctomycetota bacterium]